MRAAWNVRRSCAAPNRMIARPGEQQACPDAQGDGGRDAPVDGRDQRAPARLAQVREADGDNEERFEPFPESDDEGLQHESPQSLVG